jgi:hypothetical protein
MCSSIRSASYLLHERWLHGFCQRRFDASSSTLTIHSRKIPQKIQWQSLVKNFLRNQKRRWKWTRRKSPIWNLPRYWGSLWGIDMHIELMSPWMLWWSSRVSSCQNRGSECWILKLQDAYSILSRELWTTIQSWGAAVY